MVIPLRVNENGIIFFALTLSIGCSNSRTQQPSHQAVISGNVATGAILIDVLESGHPEYYWQYELQPSTGLVRKIKEEKFQDYAHEDIPPVFQQPTGAIEACAKKPRNDIAGWKILGSMYGFGVWSVCSQQEKRPDRLSVDAN